jgi:acyl-CoA dehydrogenase
MALAFNEEQRSLKDTAREIAQNRSPVEEFRKLRDTNDPLGFSEELWKELVELGWSGMTFPEEYGGYGFGYMGLAGCMKELGRTLAPSPLLSSVLLSGATILYGGSEEQKQQWIPEIIAGEKRFALALDEGFHHDPVKTAMTASKDGDSFTLHGNKVMVIDGMGADYLVVVARTSGNVGDSSGISLFIVDANSSGISSKKTGTIDSRNYASISFENVSVAAENLLGEADNGFAALDKALDRGRICLAAEMLGGIEEAFQRTVEYLKEREQFGAIIGTFQALQHRAAHMYTQIEMCKSSLMSALSALEEDKEETAALISACKALITETSELVTNEAVQLHGGIGVTDELDIGLFLKRARVSAELLGSASFNYSRYASLEGF